MSGNALDHGEGDTNTLLSGNHKYILAVDVGTTTIRCHIYNERAELISQGEEKVCSFPYSLMLDNL